MNKKKFFAILIVALMFLGAFVTLTSLIHPAQTSNNSPELASIGESSSNTIDITSYVNSSVSNSGTSTVDLPINTNGSANSFSYSGGSSTSTVWSSSGGDDYLNISTSSYYFSGSSSINFNFVFPAPDDLVDDAGRVANYYNVGTVYMTVVASNGDTLASASHTFNYESTGSAFYVEISFSAGVNFWYAGSVTIDLKVTPDSGYTINGNDPGPSYTLSSASNSIVTSEPSSGSTPFAYGWTYGSTTASFTIPQYESSFDVSWSSSASTNPQYNGQSPTGTSGTLTSSLTSNSITVNPKADPSDVTSSGGSTYSFSYYLSSQYQITQTSTSQSSSSSYTYNQVSGTTNQASASFSFSATTPSGTQFIRYESSTNSLSTSVSTVSFPPTTTITNPYYSYSQNEVSASISGASSGSGTSSNSENPSFSASSATYSSATSPSWTVNLNLYGNRHPVINKPVINFVKNSEVLISFDISQPTFSGESQTVAINWGNGVTSTYTDTPGNYTYYYNYTGTAQGSFSQTFNVYVEVSNNPNPDSNSLSSLSTTSSTVSFTIGLVDNPTSPDSILYKNQSVYMNITSTNLQVDSVDISINGASPTTMTLVTSTSDSYVYKYSSPLFGSTSVGIVWTIHAGGITDTITSAYATPLEPTVNSTYLTAMYSNSPTYSATFTLSNVPSGSGFYQQLLTISNPSSYGINTAGSNIQFVAGNGTLLYAWIQSINSTSMLVWIKNYNGSSIIDMQVFPSFENLFSASQY